MGFLRTRTGESWLQRWRVPLGFILAFLFILLARPQTVSLVIGVAISILGLALRAWAAGHIKKNDELAVSGPYAHTRNPLYLGSFLLGLGFAIAANRWELGLLFTILFAGIYFPVMHVESADLARLFGEDYREYARQVPLFLPRLAPYRSGQQRASSSFDANLYLRYREYRAAFGLLIAWGLLVAKSYYWK